MAQDDAAAIQAVRAMMRKILDSPDSSDRDREVARAVLDADPNEIKTKVKFVDMSDDNDFMQLDEGDRTDEPSVEMLAGVDEGMENWIKVVREEKPTTAELANSILQVPPGFTMKQNVEFIVVCLANALQRLAFGSAE